MALEIICHAGNKVNRQSDGRARVSARHADQPSKAETNGQRRHAMISWSPIEKRIRPIIATASAPYDMLNHYLADILNGVKDLMIL